MKPIELLWPERLVEQEGLLVQGVTLCLRFGF